MAALAASPFTVARPPAAYISIGAHHVPLAISSWCWHDRCGAPIAASRRAAVVRRRSTIHLELRFRPTKAQLSISGRPVAAHVHGREITWKATRSGGLTIRASAPAGWVTYVGRLRLR